MFMEEARVRFQQEHMLEKMHAPDTVQAYADACERLVKPWIPISLHSGPGIDRLEDTISALALQTLDRDLFTMGHKSIFPATGHLLPKGYADDMRMLYAVATRGRVPPPNNKQIKKAIENHLTKTRKFFK